MDINTLIILMVFSLVLVLLGFLGRTPGWAIFPFFGGVIATIGTLALLNDGSLTQLSGGVVSTLAAANGNFVSDFNALSIMPIAVTLTGYMITIRRAFRL